MSTGAIVITGATGFVGRHLMDAMLAAGRRVVAIVRDAGAPLPPAVERVVVSRWDSPTTADVVGRAAADAEAVLHLAGRAHHVRETIADPIGEYRLAHVETTRVLLRALRGSSVRRLVVLSTVAAAVAETEQAVDDAIAPAPASPYGKSKREMELIVEQEAPALGIEPVILRPPMVYGAGMKGNPLRLMRLIADGRPIPVSVPSVRRSVLYVGNLVRALCGAVARPALGPAPYFVTDGPAPTVSEFAQAMAAALDVQVRFVRIPEGALRAVGRIGDLLARAIPFPVTSYEIRRLTSSVQVDGSRFWREVGEEPPYTMSEGMRGAAAWFRSVASSAHSR